MTILTPARAKNKKDLKLRYGVLKEKIQGRYKIGFEVILLGGAEGDLKSSKKIAGNLEPYRKKENFQINLHHSIERKDFSSKSTDLTRNEGLQTLSKALELANEIRAEVVVHTENFYFGKEIAENKISLKKKRALQKKIKEEVIREKKKTGFEGKIAFENVPPAIMGDWPGFDTAENMIYDPLIITADDFSEFADLENNIGVCFDVCHYNITKKAIGRVLKRGVNDLNIRKFGLLCLPKEQIKEQPGYIEVAEKLGKGLFEIHFSDSLGLWEEGKSYYKEGVALGEGENTDFFKELLGYLKNKDISVNLEVKDKNLKLLEETKKSIKWLINS